jgi:glutamate---cysteine ligase / carboxylate-amine ligase
LELRISDSCTRLDDTLAIAAFYRCLVRMAVRQPNLNRGLTGGTRALVSENLWRAQRDGIHANFINVDTGVTESVQEFLTGVLNLVAMDARALGCEAEVQSVTGILANGTSADRQIACFDKARIAGEREGLSAVVDLIAQTTAA